MYLFLNSVCVVCMLKKSFSSVNWQPPIMFIHLNKLPKHGVLSHDLCIFEFTSLDACLVSVGKGSKEGLSFLCNSLKTCEVRSSPHIIKWY